ncbi:tryptophan synthase subunit beta [Salisediminibacterium halotolerans]|uniref:Multifunctional fusion protein n=1 Tax=Salisediminibacterium halotolerans TaxID=517425 RepID=A0A1H9P2S7_9BACI|nr:tryptophan synthase subunit beta [Salisediminibacterium haloalkalitolerans]SER42215.1 tryptophan synthase beta chain/phosphoribosylanthranilate isomerase [Salisediminibacterium haloalkalitolerans]
MRPQIKFCGMRSKKDVVNACSAGADYLGFIFAPSKRRVRPEDVCEWTAELPQNNRALLTGVFVDEEETTIIQTAKTAGLDIIQCHGNETSADVHALKTALPGVQVFKTIHHESGALLRMKEFENAADGFLVDTKTEHSMGGTGTAFDWDAVPEYSEEAKRQGVPIFIAGGITAANADELLNYHPWGLDISSGIETGDEKDYRKMVTIMKKTANVYAFPDELGRYGDFGGKYVPETLMYALTQLEEAYHTITAEESFKAELQQELKRYAGRPTEITYAGSLTEAYGGAQIYLKREDLLHTGAHKINNALAQGLLAKKMGKTEIIAETGAGQHGVATATMAARFGLSCKVFMGAEDMKRQELNVFRMRLLGAEVLEVQSGGKTLKDATNEAIRHWVANVDTTFYLIGSVVGPHPYPMIVRNFQRVIGDESIRQMEEICGKQPAEAVACVGGGSNAMGMFYPYINSGVRLTGIEAAGKGMDTPDHAATLSKGRKGVLHGALSYLIQDDHGNVFEPYSISAGLDYPGIGPEHAHLHDSGIVNYEAVTDDEAMDALEDLCRLEGILPAIETAHALAYVKRAAKSYSEDDALLVCLSGRGDKDVHTIQQVLGGADK